MRNSEKFWRATGHGRLLYWSKCSCVPENEKLRIFHFQLPRMIVKLTKGQTRLRTAGYLRQQLPADKSFLGCFKYHVMSGRSSFASI